MMKTNTITLLFLILLAYSWSNTPLLAQDPTRFSKEVEKINGDFNDSFTGHEIHVFTGSSTIRMWKSLQEDFPGMRIVNTGFGGSQTSDLIYYYDQLIRPYAPGHIFIYEGDNDLAAGKGKGKIMKDMKTLVERIRADFPAVSIYLISAKPSLARWDLKKKYVKLNKKLANYCRDAKNITFIDVWPVMLDDQGNPKADIFIEDGLHMNEKGYALWREVFKAFVK